MLAPVLTLIIPFLLGTPTTLAAEKPLTAMTEPEIDAWLTGLQAAEPDTGRRLAAITRRMVGTPYRFSPLGEGPGVSHDTDPLFRLDAMDCLSLIEISLALARSTTLLQAIGVLQEIRYSEGPPLPRRFPLLRWLLPALDRVWREAEAQSARVDFRRRRHFMMSQWLPQNQQAGFVRDITEVLGGELTRVMEKTLDPGSWDRRRFPKWWPRLNRDQIPLGAFRLPYVPLDRVMEMADRVPEGTIVCVIRQDDPGFLDLVVHLALVVKDGDQILLRHAARKGYAKIIDEPLLSFIQRNQRRRKWPLAGMNFQVGLPAHGHLTEAASGHSTDVRGPQRP